MATALPGTQKTRAKTAVTGKIFLQRKFILLLKAETGISCHHCNWVISQSICVLLYLTELVIENLNSSALNINTFVVIWTKLFYMIICLNICPQMRRIGRCGLLEEVCAWAGLWGSKRLVPFPECLSLLVGKTVNSQLPLQTMPACLLPGSPWWWSWIIILWNFGP